jgi:hypothetical protein
MNIQAEHRGAGPMALLLWLRTGNMMMMMMMMIVQAEL